MKLYVRTVLVILIVLLYVTLKLYTWAHHASTEKVRKVEEITRSDPKINFTFVHWVRTNADQVRWSVDAAEYEVFNHAMKASEYEEMKEIEKMAYGHIQNYHFLSRQYPHIGISTHFIGQYQVVARLRGAPNVSTGKTDRFLTELRRLAPTLQSEWTIVTPPQTSVYTKSFEFVDLLNGLDDDVKIYCPISMRGEWVNITDIDRLRAELAEHRATQANLTREAVQLMAKSNYNGVNGQKNETLELEQTAKAREMFQTVSKMGERSLVLSERVFFYEHIEQMMKTTDKWFVDIHQTLTPRFHTGCDKDHFAIRTKWLKHLLDWEQRYHRAIDNSVGDRLHKTQIGLNKFPVLSHWLIEFSRYSTFVNITGNENATMAFRGDIQRKNVWDRTEQFTHEELEERYTAFGNPLQNVEDSYRFHDQVPAIYTEPDAKTELDFAYVPKRKCSAPFVALIKTAFLDSKNILNWSVRRDLIRKMFGGLLNENQYCLYFLIGNSTVTAQSQTWNYRHGTMKKELEKHDDIVVGHFVDNYENLPIKTFLGYKYLEERHSSYKYVTFTDDDCMLDLKLIVKFASEQLDFSQPSIICIKGKPINMESAPLTGKYYLWDELFPSAYSPPPYCNGQCSLLTKPAAAAIYAEAKTTDRHEFRLEDFYFTGILRQKAGLPEPKPLAVKMPDNQSAFKALCHHYGEKYKQFFEWQLDSYIAGNDSYFIPPSP